MAKTKSRAVVKKPKSKAEVERDAQLKLQKEQKELEELEQVENDPHQTLSRKQKKLKKQLKEQKKLQEQGHEQEQEQESSEENTPETSAAPSSAGTPSEVSRANSPSLATAASSEPEEEEDADDDETGSENGGAGGDDDASEESTKKVTGDVGSENVAASIDVAATVEGGDVQPRKGSVPTPTSIDTKFTDIVDPNQAKFEGHKDDSKTASEDNIPHKKREHDQSPVFDSEPPKQRVRLDVDELESDTAGGEKTVAKRSSKWDVGSFYRSGFGIALGLVALYALSRQSSGKNVLQWPAKVASAIYLGYAGWSWLTSAFTSSPVRSRPSEAS
ncbi:hypothetical protein GQ42DRAFT_160824 [Ramicandelaber brevisporus]|nr:hypothetical protein GQ42DRAFT_160824 [Ramicandelaber brevisporus]